MKKNNLYIALITILTLSLLSGCQSFGPKVTSAPEVLAEFDFSNTENGILLPVMFQDENYKFLLDTGTHETILDDSLKSKLRKQLPFPSKVRLSNGKTAKVVFFHAPDIYLGPFNLKCSPIMGVVDLDSVPGVEQESRQFQGIIGMDFLQKYIVQIDFDQGKVTFFKSKKEFDLFSLFKSKENKHPEWGEPIPLKTKLFSRLRYIKGKLTEDISDEFMIDSGLIGHDELKSSLFDKVPYKLAFESKSENARTNAGLSSNIDSKMIEKFSVGSLEYENRIFETNNKSVLGLWFLACHKVTFDFPNNMLYLKKGKIYNKPYTYNVSIEKIGFVLGLNGEKLWVSKTDPNGLAQRKGIRQNDIIKKIQINEKVLTSFNTVEFLEFISKLPKLQDSIYILTFKRGEEIFTVEFTKQDLGEDAN